MTRRKWTPEDLRLFKKLMIDNIPLTRIHKHFPLYTWRQIEWRAEQFSKLNDIPMPDRATNSKHTDYREDKPDFGKFDFSNDNVEARDR